MRSKATVILLRKYQSSERLPLSSHLGLIVFN